MFTWFDLAWPWIGLVAAAVLAVLLATPVLRSDRTVLRRHDPRWMGFLAVVVYLVHQVEEYGVSALGVPHAFPDELCGVLDQPDFPACAIPPAFFLAVNLSLVWVAGPIAAWLAPRRPAVALVLWAVIAVNSLAHVIPAIAMRHYDAGLLSAVLLFVPLSVWALRSLTSERGPIPRRMLLPLLGAGVLMHAVLIGSLLLVLHAGLPPWAAVALQPVGVIAGYALVLWRGAAQGCSRDRPSDP